MLPQVLKINYCCHDFPAGWQAVIFRNFGLVKNTVLAKILETEESTIEVEAERLGISNLPFCEDWVKKGYITLIRNNWHLLNYEQIETLLGIDGKELDFILKEDDFLDVKLGGFKPDCGKTKFEPLTAQQKKISEEIGDLTRKNLLTQHKSPFDFYSYPEPISAKKTGEKVQDRILYSYSAKYGDSLLEGADGDYPEVLLQQLSDRGINGIWMQSVLSKVSPYPFKPDLSENFELRRENLRKLIQKCGKYGIKIYLYFNEPRYLSSAEIDESLAGHREGDHVSLCTDHESVQDYLYGAVKSLLAATPGLGGIITITMSENLTHCYSHGPANCPRCKHISAPASAARVNNLFMKAARDAGTGAEIIANLWGWAEYTGWTEQMTLEGIRLLDPDITVMCVSECEKEIRKGGVSNRVIDYSMSNIGPSKSTERNLNYAKKLGHKIAAKVQINNSWECCAVPYIPVFGLIDRHLRALNHLGTETLMLSWTLGSYPSLNLDIANYSAGENSLKKFYAERFGADALAAEQAIDLLSNAFEALPFDISFLYYAPQNVGCANRWERTASGMTATMVGYPYDDLERWRGNYPLEVFLSQLEMLVRGWENGLLRLKEISARNPSLREIADMATVVGIHFKSTLLQVEYIRARDEGRRSDCLYCAEQEQKLVSQLYEIVCRDARIGFEPSNHYYYNANTLLEKTINLHKILAEDKR